MGLHLVGEHEAGALRGLYEEIRSTLGLELVPNVFKAMAGVNPDVLVQNWTAFRYTLLEGGLPRQMKEMIGAAVSHRNRCSYSLHLHARRLLLLGVPGPVVDGLVAHGDSEGLPERTRAVLQCALACAEEADRAEEEALAALGLSEEEIQEVVDTVLMVTGLNRFTKEMGIPLDEAS